MSEGAVGPAGAEPGHIRVVGTAHVSSDSVDEVEAVLRADRPDVVAVELDEARYRQLRGETPEDLNPSDLLGGNTVFQFLAYWMLSYVQARLGDRFDIRPGADMLAAVETAEELDLAVALVDRDIQVTIQRFWAKLSTLERLKLIGGLALGVSDGRALGMGVGAFLGLMAGLVLEAVAGPFVLPPGGAGPVGAVFGIGAAGIEILLFGLAGLLIGGLLEGLVPDPEEDLGDLDIADLTDADVVTAMLKEFRRFSPGGARALIDERDAYIAHQLIDLRRQGKDVVAVVGAGHRAGIEGYLERPETLPPLSSVVGRQGGRRFSLYKLLGYLFTLGFLVFFLLLAMAGVRDTFLLKVFAAWFLINGVFAAGLARLAGAHWTSALVGGGVAWLTSVNPLLAPGWFAGYVELRYTTVNVSDIGKLNDILTDEETPIRQLLDQLREVPLFRLIAIVAMTNIGSFIASILFATVILPTLSLEIGGVDAVARLMVEGAKNSADLLLRGLR